MASLYKSTQQTRKIIIGILIFFALVLLVNLYSNLTKGEPVVTVNESDRYYIQSNRVFGEIPIVTIPGIEYNSNATFTLESVHTQFFPDVAFVYPIEQPRERLLSLAEAKQTADSLGFVSNAYAKSGSLLTWRAANDTKILTYDLTTREWKLDTRYLDNESALARKDLFSASSLVELKAEYEKLGARLITGLRLAGLGLSEIRTTATIARKGIDGFLTEVDRIAEAEYIHVSLNRTLPISALKPRAEQPQNGTPPPAPASVKVYSDDPREGQVTLLVSNQVKNFLQDIFELSFIDFEYNEQITGVYSIITPEEAWANVQQGLGSLTFIEKQDSNYFAEYSSVNVRRFNANAQQTELVLYEPDVWTGYTTPIYLFRGIAEMEDGQLANFIFYVDAIKRLT